MTAAAQRLQVASAMSEDDLLGNVLDLARVLGWWAHHCRPARTAHGWRTPVQGNAGFPDLILVRDGWLIAAELKRQREKPTAAQGEWLGRFQQVGFVVGNRPAGGVRAEVWRPVDLLSGAIRAALETPGGAP